MPIWNLTYEKKEELLKELNNKKDMLTAIEIKTIENMWLDDLEAFENEYSKYLKNRMKELENQEETKSKKKK
jgi:DNA topoisomerase-2